MRADKLCLAALAATLTHYLRGEALLEIPVWRMIAERPDDLRARAAAWAQRLDAGEVQPGRSTVGGGSLPEETLPTWLLDAGRAQAQRASSNGCAWRPSRSSHASRPATVALDPRTVLPEQEGALLAGLQTCLKISA